jgi:hypothetical protein
MDKPISIERLQRCAQEQEAIGEILEAMARERLEIEGYDVLGRGWKKEHTAYSHWELLDFPYSQRPSVVIVHFWDRRNSWESIVRLTMDKFSSEAAMAVEEDPQEAIEAAKLEQEAFAAIPDDPYDIYKDLRWDR